MSTLLSNLETADALVREIGEDRVTNVSVSTHTDTISVHLADDRAAAWLAHTELNLEDDRDVGTYRGVQVLLYGALREQPTPDVQPTPVLDARVHELIERGAL